MTIATIIMLVILIVAEIDEELANKLAELELGE